jgi:phenylacetate-coenzyme A ligase PaaK-like adenylate-forming protein
MPFVKKLLICSSIGFISYGTYRCYDNFNTKYQNNKKFNENINRRIKSFTNRTVENSPIYNSLFEK